MIMSSDSLNSFCAIEYVINEDSMDIEQILSDGAKAGPIYYSPSVGDLLRTLDKAKYIGGLHNENYGKGRLDLRVVEGHHYAPAEKAFEVIFYNSTPDPRIRGYRSERIPNLYLLDICEVDLNNVGLTNSLNLGLFRQCLHTSDTHSDFDPGVDFNGDGAVNLLDSGIVRALFHLDHFYLYRNGICNL
jgi:hypothetical protein